MKGRLTPKAKAQFESDLLDWEAKMNKINAQIEKERDEIFIPAKEAFDKRVKTKTDREDSEQEDNKKVIQRGALGHMDFIRIAIDNYKEIDLKQQWRREFIDDLFYGIWYVISDKYEKPERPELDDYRQKVEVVQ